MVDYCCVANCKNKTVKGRPVTFHRFPKYEKIRKIWERNVKKANFTGSNEETFKITKHTRICSKHFPANSFEFNKGGAAWVKFGAVPTIFDFSHPEPKEKGSESPLTEGLSQVPPKDSKKKERRLITRFKPPVEVVSKEAPKKKGLISESDILEISDAAETDDSGSTSVSSQPSSIGLKRPKLELEDQESEDCEILNTVNVPSSALLPSITTQSCSVPRPSSALLPSLIQQSSPVSLNSQSFSAQLPSPISQNSQPFSTQLPSMIILQSPSVAQNSQSSSAQLPSLILSRSSVPQPSLIPTQSSVPQPSLNPTPSLNPQPSPISASSMIPQHPPVNKQLYDSFGEHVAEKLRSMPHAMVPMCQKLISEAIFYGEMNKLNMGSRIVGITEETSSRNNENFCSAYGCSFTV